MKTDTFFLLVLPIILLVVLLGLLLTSCADFPVTVSYKGDYGTYGYSSKSGVQIQIDPTK